MRPLASRFDGTHALKCELASEVLRSSGSLRLQVTGWSMLPAVWPGDTLVVERVACDEVSEGDIVLFGRDQRLFAHRVITKPRTPTEKVLTRGDAMTAVDSPVSGDELLGKVSFILRNGRCIAPSRSLHFSERAVAALVRSSKNAARVVVRVHNMRQTSVM
jgi:signal peptidase I